MKTLNQEPAPTKDQNVVSRLRSRLDDARGLGFRVRMVALDGEQATWCVIGGVPTLFVDLSQTAAEQLQQVNESLKAYCQRRLDTTTVDRESMRRPHAA